MKFNVCFINTDNEVISEVGVMTIAEVKEFIAVIETITLEGDWAYNDHFYSIEDKTFYIEVV
jgi:hypothetical protein